MVVVVVGFFDVDTGAVVVRCVAVAAGGRLVVVDGVVVFGVVVAVGHPVGFGDKVFDGGVVVAGTTTVTVDGRGAVVSAGTTTVTVDGLPSQPVPGR